MTGYEEFQRIMAEINYKKQMEEIRFRNFIRDTDVCDAISEEEKEYLLMVAGNLLHYQIETATDESELKYLENIKDLI